MLASCDLRWRDIVYVLLLTVGTFKCVMTIQTLNIPLSALTDSRNTDELSSDSRCPMSETGFKFHIAEGERAGDSSEVCPAYCARQILPQPAGPAAIILNLAADSSDSPIVPCTIREACRISNCTALEAALHIAAHSLAFSTLSALLLCHSSHLSLLASCILFDHCLNEEFSSSVAGPHQGPRSHIPAANSSAQ